jgi:hypothetical protein
MHSGTIGQPTIRFDYDRSFGRSGIVGVRGLSQEAIAICSEAEEELLKLAFPVTVARDCSQGSDNLPNVSGRYVVLEDELQFVPHFPLEAGLKYHARFDLPSLGISFPAEPLVLDFSIPEEESPAEHATVTAIFPSSDVLPENLLRFYVCFSSGMQRGRASEEISLRDSYGQPVADALYRPPVELWDKTMRHLTVLLDPGRLKRWVGPNRELGPPLKAGEQYTLEVGSGMLDKDGRPIREPSRKHFRVDSAVRDHISIEHWKILPPPTDSLDALVLVFPHPLDWALLFQTITVKSAEGGEIRGEAVVDQRERRWSFIPLSPWTGGLYQIRVSRNLEDVCGNTITGAFDKPLTRATNLETQRNMLSLKFLVSSRFD